MLRYTVRFASSGMRPAGGLTGMADNGGDRELTQRFRGDTRAATSPPGSPAAPVLSAELRERLDAAVIAERSVAAAREQNRAAGAEVTTPSARAANAGPLTEDEVTEWIGTAGKSREAAPGVAPGVSPDAEPESASWLGVALAALIVIPALVIGSLTVVVVRHFTGTGSPPSAAAAVQEAATRHEAVVRGQAAAWVAQQVSPGVAVSCDQVMCVALEARGLSVARPARARAAFARSTPLRRCRRDRHRPGAVRYQPRPGLGAGRPRVFRLRVRGHHRPGRCLAWGRRIPDRAGW